MYLSTSIFIYLLYYNFTGIPLIDPLGLFYISTIFICLPLLTFAICNDKYDEVILKKYKSLYKDGVTLKY